MSPAEIREIVERSRRASIHRQIGALKTRITTLRARALQGDALRVLILTRKIARLESLLTQPMLIPTVARR